MSRHAPQREEILQPNLVLTLDTCLLVRPAHFAKIAPATGALAWCGRKQARGDGAIDDLQHLDAAPAYSFIDLQSVLSETAGGGAEKEAGFANALLFGGLDGKAVEHGLQDLARADHRV